MKKTFTIDLRGLRPARVLHAKLAEVLPVPADYGRNYDALYDFLTESGPGLKIVFTHAAAAPATLRRVCADAVAETPGLEITWSRA